MLDAENEEKCRFARPISCIDQKNIVPWHRIFHQEAICWDLYYMTCLHDNLVTVLGWMNADIPAWLATIDPFDEVCRTIRKDMGWPEVSL
jgi:hypothetical protein